MFDKHIFRIFLFFILSSVIIVLITIGEEQLETPALTSRNVKTFDNGWSMMDKEGNIMAVTLPMKIELLSGDKIQLNNQLPEYFSEEMSLSFMTNFTNIKVYHNQDILYQHKENHISSPRDKYESIYHLFRLPSSYKENPTLTLEITGTWDGAGKINDIIIGSKSAIIHHIILNNLFFFIICIIILMIGCFLIIMSSYSIRKFKEGKSLLYLGSFLILFSFWSITETSLFHFLIPYQSIGHIISYQSFLLTPFPFILYLKGASHSSKYKKLNILLILFSINYILNNMLSLLGITRFGDLSIIFLILIIFTLIATILTIIRELSLYKTRDTYILVISILILCIAASLDIICHYHIIHSDSSYYLRIGILFFTIFNGLTTLKKTISVVKIGINSRAIEKLAYTDILTNIKNRTSYVQDIEQINQSLEENSDIITVMFDLNNLKEANDQYGHDKGDKLLIAAAESIRESFGDYGDCYRIGGDEFAVIIKNVYDSFFQDSMAHLHSVLEEYNKWHAIKLEIPFGYTHYKHEIDRDLYATISRADALMYEAKAMMKAESIKL